MAGNKALKKFADSKIPQKGKGTLTKEINIYKEPNTHSEIVGKINAGEEIFWISKSICEEREWVRCDKTQNFGYIVAHEKDGLCNVEGNFENIKLEKTEDKKVIENVNTTPELTEDEIEMGNEALKEIFNDDKKAFEYDDEPFHDKSTVFSDSQNNSLDEQLEKINNIEGLDDINIMKEYNVNDVNVCEEQEEKINFALFEKEVDLFQQLFTEMEKEKEKKDNQESEVFKNTIDSIMNLLPDQKSKEELKTYIDNSKKEEVPEVEIIMNVYNNIPGMNSYQENLSKDIINLAEYTIEGITDSEEGFRKLKGTFKYKKNEKITKPKYYENGWNGGTKDHIKTIKSVKIADYLKIFGYAVNFINISKAFVQDKCTVGENCAEEIASYGLSKLGAKFGCFIGRTFLRGGPVGAIIGAVAGGMYLAHKYKEPIGHFIYEKIHKFAVILKENINDFLIEDASDVNRISIPEY